MGTLRPVARTPPAVAAGETASVGGCSETPIKAETNRIDGANLPWAYVVVNEATIDCQDRRVLVHAVSGPEIVLASLRSDRFFA